LDEERGITDAAAAPEQAGLAVEPPGEQRSRLITGAVFLLTVASYLCQPNYDPGFYEHLAIGRYLTAQGAAPDRFIWSMFGSSQAWAPPSLLWDSLLGTISNIDGMRSLLVFKVALYVVAVFCLYFAYLRASADRFLSGLVATVVAAGVLVRGEFTPDLPGLIGLALVFAALSFPRGQSAVAGAMAAVVTVALMGISQTAALTCVAVSVLAALLSAKRQPGSSATVVATCASVGTLIAGTLWPFAGSSTVGLRRMIAELSYLGRFEHVQFAFDYAAASFVLLLFFAAVLAKSIPSSRQWLALPALSVLLLPSLKFLLVPYGLACAGYLACRIWGASAEARNSQIGTGVGLLHGALCRTPEPGTTFLLLCFGIVNVFALYQMPEVMLDMPGIEARALRTMKKSGSILTEPLAAPFLMQKLSTADGVPLNTAYPSRIDLSFNPAEALAAVEAIDGRNWKETLKRQNPDIVIVRTAQPLAQSLKEEIQTNPDSGWTVFSSGSRLADSALQTAAEVELPQGFRPAVDWTVFVRTAQ
jgi:hypothetical protein